MVVDAACIDGATPLQIPSLLLLRTEMVNWQFCDERDKREWVLSCLLSVAAPGAQFPHDAMRCGMLYVPGKHQQYGKQVSVKKRGIISRATSF